MYVHKNGRTGATEGGRMKNKQLIVSHKVSARRFYGLCHVFTFVGWWWRWWGICFWEADELWRNGIFIGVLVGSMKRRTGTVAEVLFSPSRGSVGHWRVFYCFTFLRSPSGVVGCGSGRCDMGRTEMNISIHSLHFNLAKMDRILV